MTRQIFHVVNWTQIYLKPAWKCSKLVPDHLYISQRCHHFRVKVNNVQTHYTRISNIYLQVPMCRQEFQLLLLREILLLPSHIHCHQPHQQWKPFYLRITYIQWNATTNQRYKKGQLRKKVHLAITNLWEKSKYSRHYHWVVILSYRCYRCKGLL